MQLTPHFSSEEMECPCGCGEKEVDNKAVRMLEKARVRADLPFKINSAKRCVKHNAEVGGVSSSAHVSGYAFDIAVNNNSKSRYRVIVSLIDAGFNRIGIAKTFIHCDADPRKPKNVVWVY